MKFSRSQIGTFKKLGVRLIYIFGSFAEGKFLGLSDVDIGIVFSGKSFFNKDFSQTYNRLYNIFTDVFPNKKVDIVFLQKSTLELRFDVVRHGKIIYAETADEKLAFEEQTMQAYADFKPLLDEFNRAILSRG